MGGDLTSSLEFGYKRYHKIPDQMMNLVVQ